MAYVMRKVKTREQVTEKIKQLMALCIVSPINRQVINDAVVSHPSDFEDPCNTSPPYRQEPILSLPGMPTGSKSSTCL